MAKKNRTKIEKHEISDKKKLHYIELEKWLKQNKDKGIVYKKIYPFGFSINISTIPSDLVDEFIKMSTYN